MSTSVRVRVPEGDDAESAARDVFGIFLAVASRTEGWDSTVPSSAIDFARARETPLEIDLESGTIARPGEEPIIGLRGIMWGFALDASTKALRERGVDRYFISAGDLVIVGKRQGERKWHVGLRDPRGATEILRGFLDQRGADT